MPSALITGAAKRIGRIIALKLAANGYDIYIHYHHSFGDAESLATEIQALGRKSQLVKADLSDHSQVETLLSQCTSLEEPTCLINNAASFVRDTIDDLDSAVWDAQLAATLKAPIFLSRAFAKILPPDQDGVIVNLLDAKLNHPTPAYLSYTIAKAGLKAATTMLAKALAPRIRVCAVAPGITLPSGNFSQEKLQAYHAALSLGRGATPEDIAAAVLYLVTAPAVTGEIIHIDGGGSL